MHDRLAALQRVSELTDSKTLLLDGGDALAGSNTAFRWQEPVLEQLRQMGYQAQTMGNREFHYLRFVQRWREQERGFPLLASNLVDLTTPHRLWRTSLERNAGGVKVGLVGCTPVQYPVGHAWERLLRFRFLPPEQVLPPLIEELRARCDVVLHVSHLGLAEDRRIAPLLPRLDAVLGAHSHDITETPLEVAGCPIFHIGSHSRFLGQIDYDGSWRFQLLAV